MSASATQGDALLLTTSFINLASSGVVRYAALGRMPLSSSNSLISSVHFRAGQSLTAAFARFPLQRLYSATSAVVVHS